jgi:hypothetical protein
MLTPSNWRVWSEWFRENGYEGAEQERRSRKRRRGLNWRARMKIVQLICQPLDQSAGYGVGSVLRDSSGWEVVPS